MELGRKWFTRTNPPEALEKLRDNTHCINFLENGLYIKLSDKVYGYRHELSVDEDNLLAVDEDELTEYCHKANVIILGGLGFLGVMRILMQQMEFI